MTLCSLKSIGGPTMLPSVLQKYWWIRRVPQNLLMGLQSCPLLLKIHWQVYRAAPFLKIYWRVCSAALCSSESIDGSTELP